MYALGVDIGGTNARAALVDVETGRVVASQRVALGEKSPPGVVQAVLGLTKQVDGGGLARSVGIGFAGMLRDGVVLNAPNLGWRDVPLAGLLHAAMGKPVHLFNDLSAIAWGEFVAGAARGATDCLTVFVGTGVGSAIVSNGQLVSGATGVAGELGHIKVVLEGGRACGCGQTGCLEAYAGGGNLDAQMREAGLEGRSGDLEARAFAGEARARALYDVAANHLVLAIANQVSVLNPSVLVLGGGVLANSPRLVQRIRDAVSKRSTVASAAAVDIRSSSLGDDAGVVGAAHLSSTR